MILFQGAIDILGYVCLRYWTFNWLFDINALYLNLQAVCGYLFYLISSYELPFGELKHIKSLLIRIML
jgi:hypothetical protein